MIDGENISCRKAESILAAAKEKGVLDMDQVRVYGLQKDERLKGWYKKAQELGIKEIRLFGEPSKDKVDIKIQKDAINIIEQVKNIDIICIATSDKGYADSIYKLREYGKRVVVIGEENASDELRDACNVFIEV